MTEQLFERANILMQQGRNTDALNVLSQLMQQDPGNPFVFSMIAEIKINEDKYPEAEDAIKTAIGILPDCPPFYYILSRVYLGMRNGDDAEANIKTAIELDPSDADFHAWLGYICVLRNRFNEGLTHSNEALRLEPDNILALNTRSTALLKLGFKEESGATIEGALNEDPENAYTHSNQGWRLLELGDHEKALDHFKEALQRSPGMEHAQAGMMEAIKAKYWFYRIFLKYAFWMSNLSKNNQWLFILGIFFLPKLLRSLAGSSPELAPVITPLIYVIFVLVISTWLFEPIGNMLLWLNYYGRHLLKKDEKTGAFAVLVCAVLAALSITTWLFASNDGYLVLALFAFVMMLPLGSMLKPSKNVIVLPLLTAVLGMLGIMAVYNTFSSGDPGAVAGIFGILFLGYQLAANYVVTKENSF